MSDLYARHLSGTIGTAVDGLDLRTVDGEVVAELRRLLVDRKVLFFPAQHLSPAELVAFGARFGELTPAHPVMPSLDGYPEVLEIDATRSRLDPRYRDELENDTWHTDVSFLPTPPLGSLLQAEVVPPAGGDTAFVDLQRAYETLSEPLRTLVDGLDALHDGRVAFGRFLASNEGTVHWTARSRCAGTGARATSPSGTTAAPSTTACATTATRTG
jgi:alpha-ketoglutarate-dependent sulfate ester dioxygenase